jgi:diguanylate cyclase (GGDEF)-like protein
MIHKPITDILTPPRPRPFKLTRFFSLTSLIGLVVVTTCLIWSYRALTVHHLIEHESRANADLTRAFANTVWSRYRSFVRNSSGRSRLALLADPELPRIRADVLEKMSGLQIVKIKIYNLDGLTVFSTDEQQIGEDKSANDGFRKARAGAVVSDITYRDRFDAFEGVLNKRNLISSYVPIRAAPGAPMEGVFEVYSDVTELLQQQHRAQWQVAAIVLALLGTLYLFLFLLVRKADRIIARQVREQEEKEEQVRHQAYHDALTGLPNRAYFSDQLNLSITLAARHGHASALMFIDLDRFKAVNDSLGHDAGDMLLKVVSERIHTCMRSSDILFRIGGDEFTVILPVITEPEEAASVAARILEAVAAPVHIGGHELSVGATIGIAICPDDGESAGELLRNADAAMYSAKENCRGTLAFYHGAMNRRQLQRHNLEAALHKGFRDGEFELYYQPRLDAGTRRVVGLHALLRWVSPSRGVVLPGEFISVLEEAGMMVNVGEWVFRGVCCRICRWQQQGCEPLAVSVNVSSVQFQSATFVAMVERVLAETGVAPGLIELDATELLLNSSREQAHATLAALKALGVRISIDGCATAYSSPDDLLHFGVDKLKIDRSFLVELATSANDQALVAGMIELARELGISVVAQGVETEAQAAFFSGLPNCQLQGFLFCRPLPVEQLPRFLACATVI